MNFALEQEKSNKIYSDIQTSCQDGKFVTFDYYKHAFSQRNLK